MKPKQIRKRAAASVVRYCKDVLKGRAPIMILGVSKIDQLQQSLKAVFEE
jgi:hypothetical protein